MLIPLYDSDEVGPYRTPPPLLALVPEDALVVHGGFHDLFGRQRVALVRDGDPLLPDPRTLWPSRSYFDQLYPFAGIRWDRRYALNVSPEGLDSFFSVSLLRAMERMPDAARVRLLAASGVDVLLLDRELEPAARELVELRARLPALGHELFVYRLADPAAQVQLVTTVHRVPEMNRVRPFSNGSDLLCCNEIRWCSGGAVGLSAAGYALRSAVGRSLGAMIEAEAVAVSKIPALRGDIG